MNLREAAQQALEAWQDQQGMKRLCEAMDALGVALELTERPNFTLSCGCPSQYGGVPAYWERDGSTAFGMICEKHWHEYDARSEA